MDEWLDRYVFYSTMKEPEDPKHLSHRISLLYIVQVVSDSACTGRLSILKGHLLIWIFFFLTATIALIYLWY